MKWELAHKSKPKQGVRVLLKIRGENCPVVGYWGCGEWEACVVNFSVAYGCEGSVVPLFNSEDVTHYALIDLPVESV